MLELLTLTSIDLATSAARHGEGLFETLRIQAGRPLRLAAHLDRLAGGCAFLGMEAPPDAGTLLRFLLERTECGTLTEGVLRLLAVDSHLRVTVAPWAPEPAQVAVAVSQSLRRFSGNPLNRFKTLSYLENRLLAREAATRGLFEVIALNEQGRLTDGGRTNLFLLLDGQLLTPPVADGALPGVARRTLLEAGLARETPLGPTDLARAQAALVTNSLRGALVVQALENRLLEARHPLLKKAETLLQASADPPIQESQAGVK